MARRIEVQIVGDARSLSAALGRASRDAEGFSAKMRRVGSSMTSAGRTMTRGLTLPIVAIGTAAVKSSLDFNEAMTMIETQAGAPAGEIDKLRGKVLSLAKESIHGPKALAKALFFVESAGFRGAKAMDVLKLASDGAMVGHADLEEVTSALTAAMKTGVRGTETATKAMGTLNAIVGQGQMHFEDLTGALSTGIIPAAKNVGLSLADVGGALAVLTAQGVPAQVAATRLGMAFLKMLPTNKKAIDSFKTLGIQEGALADAMRGPGGLPAAIGILRDAYDKTVKKLGKNEAMKAILGMFPRGLAKTIFTLIDSYEELGQKTDAIREKSEDFPNAVAQAWEDNINKLKKSWSSVAVALVRVGDTLGPIIVRIADAVSSLADKFGELSPQAQKLTLVVAGILAALGPLLVMLGSVVTAIGLIATPVGAAVAVLVVLGAALVALYAKHEGFRQAVSTAFLQAQVAGQRLVAWYQGTLKPAIDNVLTAIRAIWDLFGRDVLKIVGAHLRATAAIIRPALNLIKGIIELVLALIRGDWSAAWDSIKLIASSALKTIVAVIRAQFVVYLAAAKALGTAILNGLKAGLSALVPAVRGKFQDLWAFIKGAAGSAFAFAFALGSAIVRGIIAGMGDLARSIGGKIAGGIRGGIDFAKRNVGSTAEEYAARELGGPIAAGVIRGWLLGSASLPEKIGETLRKAIEAGRRAIEGARGQLAAAFEGLSSRILRAFDAESAAMETASEKRLREIDERRRMEDLLRSQADAQDRLNRLIAEGGSAQEIADARRDVSRTGEDVGRVALERQAEAERLDMNARRERQREFLEARLKRLIDGFAKEGAATKTAMAKLRKLMEDYDLDFASAGANIGVAFVRGLKAALAKAAGEAGQLKDAVAKVAAGIKIPGRARGGFVAAGSPYVVGERGPELFTPGRSGTIVPNRGMAMAGGGSRPIHIHVDLDGREMARTIYDPLKNIRSSRARIGKV